MRPVLASALASSLGLLVLPAAAGAQEANPMGQPGQIAIRGDFQLSLVRQSTSVPGDGEDPDSATTITLAPAADFFVAPGVSVGGQLAFLYSSFGDDSSATGFGAAPRVGYFAALGPKLGIWPLVSIAYLRTSVDVGDEDFSGYTLSLQAFAPLLFQPADHFFIGMGPAFQTDLISKIEDEDADKDTAFGLQTTVGGYW